MDDKWTKKIVANLIDPEEARIAILDGHGKLYDFFIERMIEHQRTGEIYKARIDSILPGMHSAFLNLGDGRNGFLYLNDVHGMEIRVGMNMLVQVIKNARKGKGARVSPRISLAGRYLVLIPNGHETGISKKIENDAEKERLREIIRKIKPNGFGVIIRTVATGVGKEMLELDIQQLLAQWNKIQEDTKNMSAPTLIHRDAGLLERVLRDEVNEDISEIIVDTEEDKDNIENFVKQFMKGKKIEVNLYKEKTSIFDVYNIENQLIELQDRKVWLNSGAYLVIDQTEALTVIDVNTGKFIGTRNLGDTVFKTNMEAAKEIARQLRLRALGGIVIIDFIDMNKQEENDTLVAELEKLLKNDKCKARVFGVTGLGLVEITRKRARTDLKSEMTRGCPFCMGLGLVEKEENVTMHIKRFIRKVLTNSNAEAILLECYPVIAEYISETVLPSWEEEFECRIYVRGCSDFSWSKYRLDMQGTIAQIEHRVEALENREGCKSVYRTLTA